MDDRTGRRTRTGKPAGRFDYLRLEIGVVGILCNSVERILNRGVVIHDAERLKVFDKQVREVRGIKLFVFRIDGVIGLCLCQLWMARRHLLSSVMADRSIRRPQKTNARRAKPREPVPESQLQSLAEDMKSAFEWVHEPRAFQLEAIKAQLQLRDVLVHAGTGFGKTVIAVGPHAHASAKGRVSFLVSPLIALQEEQVSKCHCRRCPRIIPFRLLPSNLSSSSRPLQLIALTMAWQRKILR